TTQQTTKSHYKQNHKHPKSSSSNIVEKHAAGDRWSVNPQLEGMRTEFHMPSSSGPAQRIYNPFPTISFTSTAGKPRSLPHNNHRSRSSVLETAEDLWSAPSRPLRSTFAIPNNLIEAAVHHHHLPLAVIAPGK
ncbi:MAG: hypothetical protein LQ348_007484, partial [Seirophora lacunosa]